MRNRIGRTLAVALAISLGIGLAGMQPVLGLAEGLSLSDLLEQTSAEQANAEQGAERPAMMYQAPTQEMLDAATYVVQSQLLDGEGEFPSADAFGYVQGSSISRTTIQSVRFEDSLEGAPEDAWDVSAAGDGSVLAWVELNGKLYDMTIAGDGGVALNEPIGMFCDYINLQTLDFNGCVDTSAATDMSLMFYGCMLAKDLDLRDLDTSGVTNMADMFGLCIMLERLNLESFDTSAVEDMRKMFYGTFCLHEIQTGPGFTIGEGTYVEDMFGQSIFTMEELMGGEASSPEPTPEPTQEPTPEPPQEDSSASYIPVPDLPEPMDSREQRFPEENVIGYYTIAGLREVFGNTSCDKSQIRSACFRDSLADAPEDAWDISRGEMGTVLAWLEPNGEMYDLIIAGNGGVRLSETSGCMFEGYDHLESVRFNDCVNTDDMRDMNCMFMNCTRLKEVDFGSINTSNVYNMGSMFYGCESLTELDLSTFETDQVGLFDCMFLGCSKLKRIQVSCGFVALTEHSYEDGDIAATDMHDMFDGCDATILWRDNGVEANMSSGDWLRMISIRPGTNLEDGGDAVKWLQRMLISKGILPKDSDDGIFGDKTREAWRRFREDNLWYIEMDDENGPDILSEVRIHGLVETPFYDESIPLVPNQP